MKIVIIFLISIFYNNLVFAIDIKIKAKVNNEIITNIDIDHEKKYLVFLNPKLVELNNEKVLAFLYLHYITKRKDSMFFL